MLQLCIVRMICLIGIRVGEEERTIVAGIRPFYGEEELRGKKIVIVENLEPAVIRGIESRGMLLAASSGERLSLIVPERDMPPGATIR